MIVLVLLLVLEEIGGQIEVEGVNESEDKPL